MKTSNSRVSTLLLVFLLLIAAGGLANALSLYSNADSITVRGTEGKVYFWLVNTDGLAKTVSFSADLGQLNGFFEDSGIILPEHGAKGTWLHVSAPSCFRGVENVDVKADVCDANGNCFTADKPLLVAANSPTQCDSYINGDGMVTQGFTPAQAYGDGSIASSNLFYSSYFNPTDYNVDITGISDCRSVKPGDSFTQDFSLINRGASSTFQVRTAGSENEVNAIVSPNSVSLSRGELADVQVTLSPNWVSGGQYYTNLQVLRQGVVLAEKQLCVSVQPVVDSRVRLPATVSGSQCGDISFQGIVDNKGTEDDYFNLIAAAQGKSVVVFPNDFQVTAGSSSVFTITIPANTLSEGANDLIITATSSKKSIAGQATVSINALSCAVATPAPLQNVQAQQSQSQDVTTITVGVTNSFSTPLDNVTATIEGIPSSWIVQSSVVGEIPVGATANVTLTLKQTTNEDAPSPILVVKSNGQEVSRKQLQPITAAGGVTGLFTALSQNTIFIGLLIVLALIVVLLTSRRQGSGPAQDFHDSFKQKLGQIKNAASQ